ncbi:hypothetical protein ZWY2020_004403, partial [Hordeum vulgare]
IVPPFIRDDATMPNKTVLATSLGNMKTHGDVLKMKLVIYLISFVFVATTSLRPSNKCFLILVNDLHLFCCCSLMADDVFLIDDVNNMNWCKFIDEFLHVKLSNKMYQKGCRLHLMLMYVDHFDLSIVDLVAVGDLPPPHKFVVSASMNDLVKVVLGPDRITDTTYGKLHVSDIVLMLFVVLLSFLARAPVGHLVGQFASSMTSLLGKLVEGWTALAGSDADEVVRHFTSFVGARTHHPTSCRGGYNYKSSQEHRDTQEDSLMGGLGAMDVGPAKRPDGHDVMRNVQNVSDQLKYHEFPAGDNNGKALNVVNASKGGNASIVASGSPSKRGRTAEDHAQGPDCKKRRIDPVAATRSLRDTTVGGRETKQKQAPTSSRADAQLNKGVPTTVGISSTRSSPHASLSNRGDPVVLEDMRKQSKRVKKTVSRPTKATNKDPLERIHSKLATSDNVGIHVTLVNKHDAAAPNAATSSDGSNHSSVPSVEVNTASRIIGISNARLSSYDESVSVRTAEVVPTLLLMRDATTIPSLRSASDEGSDPQLIYNKEDCRSSGTDSTRGVAGTALPTKEDYANQFTRNSSEPQERHPMDFTPPSCNLRIERTQDEPPVDPEQGQPSSADPANLVPEDVIRSATHGSVKQARVVHALVVNDCEPKQRTTREQTLLYDTIKRFSNARVSSQYMKRLKG